LGFVERDALLLRILYQLLTKRGVLLADKYNPHVATNT